MYARHVRRLLSTIGAAAFVALTAIPALAHHAVGADAALAAPTAPDASVPQVAITGTVEELVVENLVTSTTVRYVSLRLDDGSHIALYGPNLDSLPTGARVEAIGRNVGNDALFVTSTQILSLAQTSSASRATPQTEVEGTLTMVHADDFANGRGRYNLVVVEDDGHATPMNLAVTPSTLQLGMRIAAFGSGAADGFSLDVTSIYVYLLPLSTFNQIAASPATNNVLVLPIKFTDSSTSDPFTPAQINTEFQTHVAAYYQEASYGQQLLNITVACLTSSAGCTANTYTGGWLKGLDPTTKVAIATPASCNFTAIGQAADTAAVAAGYNLANYVNRYYVMPSISSCGWAGLAYIGYPYQAWSNAVNALWVYGHELGHNFTLYHAGSANCNGQTIASSGCSVSEYGDPFDVMGNINPMHFNSMQKAALNWIPASSVKTHTSGTATYTLSPIETGGQTTYAVKIPAAANRTYWVEFRQPIGFDAALSGMPNLGAQVRVAYPFETSSGSDDTEILDMTPATGGNFNDSALLVGHTYTDSTYGITINVVSATTTALTVKVTAAGAQATSSTTLTSSANPATVGTSVVFTATVAGTAPTGSVNFIDGASSIAGCSAVALTGSGNSKTAKCTTSSLTAATHSIVASYGGDSGNAGSSSTALSEVVNAVAATNYALATNGGKPSASSSFGALYPVSAINNNDRTGAKLGAGGVWQDATRNQFPDWVQIKFNAQKTIQRVVVYSVQDSAKTVEPTDTMTCTLNGLTGFQVQGKQGTKWVTLATVTGNNLVKRTVTFAPFTTAQIRINITGAMGTYSRVVEVEAWSN